MTDGWLLYDEKGALCSAMLVLNLGTFHEFLSSFSAKENFAILDISIVTKDRVKVSAR
jgi:hypothetical protein